MSGPRSTLNRHEIHRDSKTHHRRITDDIGRCWIDSAILHAGTERSGQDHNRSKSLLVRFDQPRYFPERFGCAVKVVGGVFRRDLRVPRGAAPALRTAVKFLDDSAKAGIGLPSIVCVEVIHNLVAAVVHLNLAVRTNHFVGLSNRHSQPSLTSAGILSSCTGVPCLGVSLNEFREARMRIAHRSSEASRSLRGLEHYRTARRNPTDVCVFHVI